MLNPFFSLWGTEGAHIQLHLMYMDTTVDGGGKHQIRTDRRSCVHVQKVAVRIDLADEAKDSEWMDPKPRFYLRTERTAASSLAPSSVWSLEMG